MVAQSRPILVTLATDWEEKKHEEREKRRESSVPFPTASLKLQMKWWWKVRETDSPAHWCPLLTPDKLPSYYPTCFFYSWPGGRTYEVEGTVQVSMVYPALGFPAKTGKKVIQQIRLNANCGAGVLCYVLLTNRNWTETKENCFHDYWSQEKGTVTNSKRRELFFERVKSIVFFPDINPDTKHYQKQYLLLWVISFTSEITHSSLYYSLQNWGCIYTCN